MRTSVRSTIQAFVLLSVAVSLVNNLRNSSQELISSNRYSLIPRPDDTARQPPPSA